jgi:hypothetical protein
MRYLFLLAIAACSHVEITPLDEASVKDASSDGAPSDGGFGFDVGANDAAVEASCVPHPACPTSVPAPNTPCGNTEYECEYGSAPQSWCSTIAYCTSGSYWQIIQPYDGGPCTQPSACPSTIDGVDAGSACSSNTACHYQEGTCACVNAQWKCARPTDPSCPAQRPRIGSACSTGSCAYGQFCSLLNGDIITCACGAWTPVDPPPCPP